MDPGWAMIEDDQGAPVDFVAWNYTAAEITALGLGVDWTGDGAELAGGGAVLAHLWHPRRLHLALGDR